MHEAIGQTKWILVLLKSLGISPQVSSRSRIMCQSWDYNWHITSCQPWTHILQRPTAFIRCIVVYLNILYSLCYCISFQKLSFYLLFSAKRLTITVLKTCACKAMDLVQGFGFCAPHPEELYLPKSEVDSWNMLLNSLEKPREFVNCLLTATPQMLNCAEFTYGSFSNKLHRNNK